MRKKQVFYFLFIIMIVLSGCSSAQKQENKKFMVVTSFYPIYIFAMNVTKNVPNVEVINLTKPQTGCLHDYQLTTGDLKKLENADLLLINGAGMEGFLDKVVQQYSSLPIVDSSIGASFLQEEEGVNSHIWLSLDNAQVQIENMKHAFIEYDPENEALYTQNTQQFLDSLQELKKRQQEIKLPENSIPVGSFHEGFGYLLQPYSVEEKISIFADENEMPSAKELSIAANSASENKIKLLFSAQDMGKTIAETISNESQARIFILDPITDGQPEADSYLEKMKYNLDTLEEALIYAQS